VPIKLQIEVAQRGNVTVEAWAARADGKTVWKSTPKSKLMKRTLDLEYCDSGNGGDSSTAATTATAAAASTAEVNEVATLPPRSATEPPTPSDSTRGATLAVDEQVEADDEVARPAGEVQTVEQQRAAAQAGSGAAADQVEAAANEAPTSHEADLAAARAELEAAAGKICELEVAAEEAAQERVVLEQNIKAHGEWSNANADAGGAAAAELLALNEQFKATAQALVAAEKQAGSLAEQNGTLETAAAVTAKRTEQLERAVASLNVQVDGLQTGSSEHVEVVAALEASLAEATAELAAVNVAVADAAGQRAASGDEAANQASRALARAQAQVKTMAADLKAVTGEAEEAALVRTVVFLLGKPDVFWERRPLCFGVNLVQALLP
jgi:predicted  nucleic acid-binding Zn-ribbon protein